MLCFYFCYRCTARCKKCEVHNRVCNMLLGARKNTYHDFQFLKPCSHDKNEPQQVQPVQMTICQSNNCRKDLKPAMF